VWRGTADEHGVAFVSTLLGRLYVRAGRTENGVELLRDALARFRALHVEVDAAFVEALVAEAALWAGRPREALAGVTDLRARLPDDARLDPLLHHIAGVARIGELAAAREELEAAVACARSFELPFELTLALDALEELSGSDETSRERDDLLVRLDIVRLPSPRR
jgi:hypothetical protein